MNTNHQIIIAVDGYSSCGKSTLSRDLANILGYKYVDSGAMYRACTLYLIQSRTIDADRFPVSKIISELPNIHIDFVVSPDKRASDILLNGKNVENDIRSMEVAYLVSKVSTIPELRSRMVAQQREMSKSGGLVMDGRDIGSIVFPQAELKIFMTADIEIRTQRRKLELESKGVHVSDEEVRKNLLLRDSEDTSRKESPLIQAPDALVLDNSHLNREEQLKVALLWAEARIVGNELKKN
jgi:cytidylate kinase